MPIQEFDPVALAAQDPEGRLYNKDLKPAEPPGEDQLKDDPQDKRAN